ncbi:YD repeat-containing protein [Bifidobacterium longum]|uniref:Uncharacterized protein n=3 Tax=Bifidobacterium longum TaxID=216816 RepID=A0A087BL13_BIFLN|nr:hypothetical protein BLSS_1239 [Bifidobacterium longum subsp. suis]SDO50346.1 YD repeat-containing protein [Bifidobacterium longum]
MMVHKNLQNEKVSGRTPKKIATLGLTAALCLGGISLIPASAMAADTTSDNNSGQSSQIDSPVAHQSGKTGNMTYDNYRLADGTIVRFTYDAQTQQVKIYKNGVLEKTYSGQDLLDMYSSRPNPYNTCSDVMSGVGWVNGLLWSAAGLTAETGAGGVVCAVAGAVTSGVLAIGGHFC